MGLLEIRQVRRTVDEPLFSALLEAHHYLASRSRSASTLNGARVGDVFMSLIHTAELNKAEPFD